MHATNIQSAPLALAGGDPTTSAIIEHTISDPVNTDVRKCPKMSDLAHGESGSFDLEEKQQLAVRLIVTGKSFNTIAHALEINVRTLYRWRSQDSFRKAIDHLRRKLWTQGVDRLRSLVHPALTEIEKQLKDRDQRARYRSANAVLRHANLRKCAPLKELQDDCEEDQDA